MSNDVSDLPPRWPLWRLALALPLTSALLVMALPVGERWALGWLAFAPLFAACQRRGAALGVCAALAAMGLAGWLSTTGWFYADAEPLAGHLIWNYAGLLLLGLALAAVLGALGEWGLGGVWSWIGLASLAVLGEAALLVYLPVHAGLSQYRVGLMLWVASLVGIWGVSWLVWLTNLALAELLVRRPGAGALTIAAIAALGWLPGERPTPAAPGPGTVTLGAVQDWSGALSQLAARTEEARLMGAELVVWPELSAALEVYEFGTERLEALAARPDVPPFVTSFPDDHQPLPRNTAVVFSRAGQSARYHKRKPFADEVSIHAAGERPLVVTVEGRRVGLNICFDSCFPAIMRETAALDCELILLPTLDPRGPFGTIQAMHAAFTPFRSAELGLPIVRADETAFSHITDARGRIVAEAGGGKQVIAARVRLGPRWTLYRQIGDAFLWLCGALLALAIWRGRRSREAA